MGSTCINDLLKLKWKESETAVSLGWRRSSQTWI
jgi:hypothetical protein